MAKIEEWIKAITFWPRSSLSSRYLSREVSQVCIHVSRAITRYMPFPVALQAYKSDEPGSHINVTRLVVVVSVHFVVAFQTGLMLWGQWHLYILGIGRHLPVWPLINMLYMLSTINGTGLVKDKVSLWMLVHLRAVKTHFAGSTGYTIEQKDTHVVWHNTHLNPKCFRKSHLK